MSKMQLKKISVCDLVIEEIKSSITSGQYVAGDKIPSEVELSHKYGVGRGSVREALKRLEMVGMVNIIHGKGVLVANQDSIKDRMRFLDSSMAITVPQLRDLMEVRRMIEQRSARLAAQHAKPEQLKRLKNLIAKMEQSIDRVDNYIKYDIEFHMVLAEASNNSLLPLMLDSVRDLFAKQQESTTPLRGATKAGNQFHKQIYTAVTEGDSEEASRLMLRHINDIEKTFLEAKIE